jgi:hypothetical protein
MRIASYWSNAPTHDKAAVNDSDSQVADFVRSCATLTIEHINSMAKYGRDHGHIAVWNEFSV